MINRTHDMELINSIMNHPAIAPHIQDDSGMHPALDYEGVYWLAVNEDQGFFMLHPHNCICYEVHTSLKPEIAGAAGRKAAREAIDWFFKSTPCQKIITHVPDYNVKARAFARKAGFTQEGVNRQSFLRGGKLIDQYLFGLTKSEYLCQQQQSL